MATKILHILKNDKFEDILEEFKNSEAEEVIFIFPNNSKFSQNEAHFQALDHEAQKAGKTITILSPNDQIKNYAQKYNFQFIKSPQDNTAHSTANDIKIPKDAGDDRISSKITGGNDYPDEKNSEENMENNDRSPDLDPLEFENQSEDEDKKDESTDVKNDGNDTIATLAIRKSMADIVGPKKEKGVTVKEEKNKKSEIEIKSYKTSDKISGIEKVWFNKKDNTEKKHSGNKNFSKKNSILFIAISSAVLLAILYSTFGSAQIIIKPKTQQLGFQIKVSTSSHNEKIDPLFNTIPGEYFVIENSELKTIQTTGQKEVAQKAKGKITVINAFSSSPQPLVATTRFETPDGLIYRTPRSVIVPGVTVENGIQKSGELEIEIIADQAGERYNIDPVNFTIPGLRGSTKFEKIYAESKFKITGGIIGLANIVTEEDVKNLKEEIKNKVTEKIKNELKAKSSELILVDTLQPTIINEELSNKAGEAATQLTLKTTARLNTVAFKEKDIIELINSFIKKTGDLVLIKDSLSIEYENPKIDEGKESLTFDLLVKGRAGLKIDEEKIIQKLAGIKEKEIKDSIKSMPEIETVKIIFSPFWVNRIPREIDKIKSKIEYE